ncbi:hypothetical protein [Endozoicomonas euniceicola]
MSQLENIEAIERRLWKSADTLGSNSEQASVAQAGFQLRSVSIFAAAMVFKGGIEINTFKLAGWVLVNAADPDVSDVLAFHGGVPLLLRGAAFNVLPGFWRLAISCSDSQPPKANSQQRYILTFRSPYSE